MEATKAKFRRSSTRIWQASPAREPFSLFLELNVLLYAGVVAFVAGLGWTVSTWSQQLGDVLVLTVLSIILAVCFWYCFSRAPLVGSRRNAHS